MADIVITSLLCLVISLVLLVLYLVGNFNGVKKGRLIERAESSSIFDNNLELGRKLLDKFIEFIFLKFIHNNIILKASKTNTSVSVFLSECITDENVVNYASSFITIVVANISTDLLNVFYRFYNRRNEQNYNTFTTYLSEWFVYRIRKLSAEQVTAIGDDNSAFKVKQVDSVLFTTLELEIYNKFGFLNTNNIDLRDKNAIRHNKE